MAKTATEAAATAAHFQNPHMAPPTFKSSPTRAILAGFGFARTMAINGCVISGLDPGAVPGGSTKIPRVRFGGGILWGRNRIDRRVKADLSPGMVSAVIGLIVQVPTITKWPSLPNQG